MAHCSLPIDIPLSPPSYEEAIQTSAPDIPSVESGPSDEPPPSYSEATKDDVFNSNYHPSETSEPPSTSDLAGLIIASIMSSQRSQQGRQPILIEQTSSNRSHSDRSSRNRPQTPELMASAQARSLESQRRKKWSVCLLGAGMGVFLVAGLIAAAVLRHRPDKSNKDGSASLSMDSISVPTINPLLWKITTPQPFDMDRIKTIIEQRQRQRELIDRYKGILSTPKPFNFPKDFFEKFHDFNEESPVDDHSILSFGKDPKIQTLPDWIKHLKDTKSGEVTPPLS